MPIWFLFKGPQVKIVAPTLARNKYDSIGMDT